jgi:hypothetical protein
MLNFEDSNILLKAFKVCYESTGLLNCRTYLAPWCVICAQCPILRCQQLNLEYCAYQYFGYF